MRRAVSLSTVGALVAFTSAAVAADIPRPVYKAPRTVVVPYNWTGFYLGGHIGHGWSNITGTDLVIGDVATTRAKGILGGVQGGFNYQVGALVLGVEGEYSAADVKFRQPDPLGIGAPGNATVKNDYFATVAARLGFAFDRTLLYAKGGGAWTRDKVDITDGVGGSATGRFNRSGWLIGAGVEHAFAGNWSAKLEYSYLQFGSTNEVLAVGGGLAANPASVKLDAHILKFGINYRFF